jgi:hypothetical protein
MWQSLKSLAKAMACAGKLDSGDNRSREGSLVNGEARFPRRQRTPQAELAAGFFLVLLTGFAICDVAAADESSPSAARPPAPGLDGDDVIVTGQRIGELRHQIEMAEESVLNRFNDINSTDKFDIHCREVAATGTRIPHRACESNSWREEDANQAERATRELQPGFGANESGGSPKEYLFRQLYMQHRLSSEARQLAAENEGLREAVARLGEAQEEYAKQLGIDRRNTTRSLQVTPTAEGLPFGAKQMFEVLMGRKSWDHTLTQRAFTFLQVSGEIRRMRLECEHGSQRLTYQDGVDWTVPAGWGSCMLSVGAKSDTTFALLEFE